MMPLALSLSIRTSLASRLTISSNSSSVFFCAFFFLRWVSLPTIFSMYAADSFDSTPPLATVAIAPRLQLALYGLGVVEFLEFLFLAIGSLFERRSTADSLARIGPPVDGAVRALQSCNRVSPGICRTILARQRGWCKSTGDHQ